MERQQTKLRPWHQVLIFLLACILIVSRQPETLFHAQFWGEDGTVFYADAYNWGWWPSLFAQYAGYFEIFPRLVAGLALLVPLASAPLLLNLIAIVNQILTVNLLLSSRPSAWGSLHFRTMLAGIYSATPNAWELVGTITNAQWFLVVSAFLLLVACKPRSVVGQVFDIGVLVLCGLSGPFCIFLLPISVFLAWRERDRWRWIVSSVLALTSLLQGWGLMNGGLASRQHAPFGASVEMFTRLFAAQFYLGALLGVNGLATHAGNVMLAGLAFVVATGTVLLTISLLRAPLTMGLFFVLAVLILGASLVAPRLGESYGLTILMHLAHGGGARYWFFPSLALEWLILWQLHSSQRPSFRVISVALSLILCFGILLHWRIRAFEDLHFAEYAKRFASAPRGEVVVVPENPEGWSIQLIKH